MIGSTIDIQLNSLIKAVSCSYSVKHLLGPLLLEKREFFSSGCARHDIVHKLIDLNLGESFKYPLTLIDVTLKPYSSCRVPLYVMYDIACKSQPSITKAFPLHHWSGRLGLSVFHAYAHATPCQKKYNPRLIEGFGLTDGEGMERLWSYLSKYIFMTKSMIAQNRRYTVYMAIKYRNSSLKQNMAKVLKQKINRLFVEQKKTNEIYDKWSYEKKKKIEEQYAKHIVHLGERNGCVDKKNIQSMVPPEVEDIYKYPLLLSVFIRFIDVSADDDTMVVGTTGSTYFRDNMNAIDAYLKKLESNENHPWKERPNCITKEYVTEIEETWRAFLIWKENLLRDILRSNVQNYLDLVAKLKKGYLGTKKAGKIKKNIKKQKEQVKRVVKMYNEENHELIDDLTIYFTFVTTDEGGNVLM